MFGFKRYIIGTIGSGAAIFSRIHTENRKIPCVSWPFPVIRIAPKFTYTFRRGTYQAYISISLVYKNQELVTFKQWAYPRFNIFRKIRILFINRGDQLSLLFCTFCC